jgi:hypothetical protein
MDNKQDSAEINHAVESKETMASWTLTAAVHDLDDVEASAVVCQRVEVLRLHRRAVQVEELVIGGALLEPVPRVLQNQIRDLQNVVASTVSQHAASAPTTPKHQTIQSRTSSIAGRSHSMISSASSSSLLSTLVPRDLGEIFGPVLLLVRSKSGTRSSELRPKNRDVGEILFFGVARRGVALAGLFGGACRRGFVSIGRSAKRLRGLTPGLRLPYSSAGDRGDGDDVVNVEVSTRIATLRWSALCWQCARTDKHTERRVKFSKLPETRHAFVFQICRPAPVAREFHRLLRPDRGLVLADDLVARLVGEIDLQRRADNNILP